MAKFVIVGDPHIGKGQLLGRTGIGSILNSRIVDQINILDWVLDKTIEVSASKIIITGDIFDDPKPHPTFITLFISWLKKCSSSDIDVHIIMGNHDLLRSGSFYISALDIIASAEIENVFVHKTIDTIHMDGLSFTVLPFKDRKSYNTFSNSEALTKLSGKLPYEVRSIDHSNAKILIGHLAIENSIFVGDEIDDMSNELFCPIKMFNGYDYVWMGHVHKPQVLSKFPYVSHIGSMDLSDFGETNHSKVIVIFDTEKNNSFEYLEIPTRPLRQVSISVPANIANTTDYVLSELKDIKLDKAIVKVNILLENQDAISVDRTMIENHLYKSKAFHICRINEERTISLIKKDINNCIDNTVNETVAIKMFAETNIDEVIRNDFIAIASSIVEEANSI